MHCDWCCSCVDGVVNCRERQEESSLGQETFFHECGNRSVAHARKLRKSFELKQQRCFDNMKGERPTMYMLHRREGGERDAGKAASGERIGGLKRLRCAVSCALESLRRVGRVSVASPDDRESIALVWCESALLHLLQVRAYGGVIIGEVGEVEREGELRRCLQQLRGESDRWHARRLRRLQLQVCERQRGDEGGQQRSRVESAVEEAE